MMKNEQLESTGYYTFQRIGRPEVVLDSRNRYTFDKEYFNREHESINTSIDDKESSKD